MTTVAVLEADEETVALLNGEPAETAARVDVLELFQHDRSSARTVVGVSARRTVLLVYQEHWLYEPLYRVSPDQAILTDATDVRRVRLQARDRATGTLYPTFYVNAFGLGALIPAGEHEVELDFFRRPTGRNR